MVVHAAAGATGGAVVQLAAAAGAEVIALASSAAKAEAAIALGARHGLALKQVDDLVAAVLSVTGGRGADVVYDANGRDTFGMSLDMLATFGTLVLYGQSSGPVGHSGAGEAVPQAGHAAGEGPRRAARGSLTLRWVAAEPRDLAGVSTTGPRRRQRGPRPGRGRATQPAHRRALPSRPRGRGAHPPGQPERRRQDPPAGRVRWGRS